MTDKRVIHIVSLSVLAVLLLSFFLQLWESGRIIAAILLLPAATASVLFIKKRSMLSINKDQVLLITAVAALVYVMVYYLTGLKFGFVRNPYGLVSVSNFFNFFLPIAVIIATTEVIRYVMMAQKSKLAHVLCYFSCVLADTVICSSLSAVTSFARFMDLVAGAIFPAFVSNFLYNYLAKRYGMYPGMACRAILTLHSYLFTVASKISDSLVNLFALFFPIALYFFIDMLYEKRKRYALGNSSRFWRFVSKVLTVVAVVIMIGTVMLISNQFKYGALVIATESMTGEINKGDVVIFESFEDQTLIEGQVIVFEDGDSLIVHRVVDIQIINGSARYFTKGDANEDEDTGYITNADVVGLATHRIPALGYPSLWLRGLFSR